jgi:hypothetical protein
MPDVGAALLSELVGRELAAPAGTAVALPPTARESYSPEVMVELMVRNPLWSHQQFAAYFGRPASWFSSVLASNTFQQELDKRRGEVANPDLTATMDERFRALSLQAVTVLQEKLNVKGVSDLVVLKSAELGIKALGMGNPAPPDPTPQRATGADAVAERLMATWEKMQAQRAAAVDVVATEVQDAA